MEYASYIYVYANNNNQNLTPNFSTRKNDDFFLENKFKLIDDVQSTKSNRKINFNEELSLKDFSLSDVNKNSNTSLQTSCPVFPPNISEYIIQFL